MTKARDKCLTHFCEACEQNKNNIIGQMDLGHLIFFLADPLPNMQKVGKEGRLGRRAGWQVCVQAGVSGPGCKT